MIFLKETKKEKKKKKSVNYENFFLRFTLKNLYETGTRLLYTELNLVSGSEILNKFWQWLLFQSNSNLFSFNKMQLLVLIIKYFLTNKLKCYIGFYSFYLSKQNEV